MILLYMILLQNKPPGWIGHVRHTSLRHMRVDTVQPPTENSKIMYSKVILGEWRGRPYSSKGSCMILLYMILLQNKPSACICHARQKSLRHERVDKAQPTTEYSKIMYSKIILGEWRGRPYSSKSFPMILLYMILLYIKPPGSICHVRQQCLRHERVDTVQPPTANSKIMYSKIMYSKIIWGEW